MDSPVVTATVQACASRGLATLRFDFRGVGSSTGRHEDGVGEQEDVRAAVDALGKRLGDPVRVALAGYSFGAAVAAAVAVRTPIAGLALIAPPLRVARVELPELAGPLLVVVGAEDQYCPPEALDELRGSLPTASVVVIDGADHFFFGTIAAVGDALGVWADALRAG